MSLSVASRRSQVVEAPASTTFRTYAGVNHTAVYNNSLGMHITVATGKKLVLTHLGCYAADGALPPSGVNVVTRVARFDAQSTILASMTFTSADSAFLDTTNRIILKALSSPVELTAGVHGVWTHRDSGSYTVYSSNGGAFLAVNNSIPGITVASVDYFGGDTNFPSGSTVDQYGGSTWAGYTIDA